MSGKKPIQIKVKSCPLIPINKLEIIQGNLKELSKAGYDKLKDRIARLGFDAPIFVWKNKVLDGTQRIRTVQKMIEDGFSLPGNKLPIVEIQAKDLNEAKERLLGYISQFGKVTDEGLYEFVHDMKIDFDTLDLPDFNMDKFKLGWFEKEIAQTDEDDIPEVPKKAKSKRGQIYQLDRHRVMCGDSTCREDVERLMGNKKVDMVFADPPYNIGYKYNSYSDKKVDREYLEFCNKWFEILECGKIVITPGTKNLSQWLKRKEPTGIGIWIKKNWISSCKIASLQQWEPILFYGSFARSRPSDLYEINRVYQEDVKEDHPCPKQIELLEDIIGHYGGNLIFDPFLGSGSTLIACEKTNRICFGMEIDPIYVDVIIKRWEDYVGKKAVLK